MEASRFLATTLWICAEQNVTVGDPEREGRAWLKGVLVEQNGKVRVVSVRKEIGRYVRDMVTGFLEDNCMEFTTAAETILVGFLRAGPGFHCKRERRN